MAAIRQLEEKGCIQERSHTDDALPRAALSAAFGRNKEVGVCRGELGCCTVDLNERVPPNTSYQTSFRDLRRRAKVYSVRVLIRIGP